MYFADNISGKKFSKDPAVVKFTDKYYMYYSIPPYNDMQGWSIGCAVSEDLENWTVVNRLLPENEDEKKGFCAPAVCEHDGKIYMFYAGGYNNEPQQIGCAVSEDGINFKRLGKEPFLKNGEPGEWNSSESGHPFVFCDTDGKYYLFYQGNNDNGESWYLSKKEFIFENEMPKLI